MDELKFIVNELNTNFETDYNMISFDSLSATDLLQVLVNVLTFVNATHKFDVSQNKDQAIMNILNILQTIKYIPVGKIDAVEFRDGLIIGKRNIIHPILYWILANIEKVKKRVYFATYVSKVEVPLELTADTEIEQVNKTYDRVIEEFWASYNENRNEKKNADESSELQDDTKKMAADMSFLVQRLEIQNDKLKNIPNRETLLSSVKAYRKEIQQEKKLQTQLREHKNILNEKSNEIKSLQGTLNQISSRRPENMDPVQQINEEIQINKIFAESQLPKENREVLIELEAFEKVVVEAEPSQDELNNINSDIEHLTQAVQVLLGKKMALTNTNDDQLLPFRNQASIIANKKQELSHFIMKIKTKNENVLDLINQKTLTLREIVGGDILHGDELKNFIANLRERSVIYKKYRAFLQGIQAEMGVVARTLDVLKGLDVTVDEAIRLKKENIESNQQNKMDDISEIKYKSKMLYQDANTKRSETLRIFEELVQLKSTFSDFNDDFDQSKREFDNATDNLSDDLIKIERLIEDFSEDIKQSETEWKTISKDIESCEMIITKYSENVKGSSDIVSILENLSDKSMDLQRSKKDLDIKLTNVKELKFLEQDELEQLKRIKQMILYKIQTYE